MPLRTFAHYQWGIHVFASVAEWEREVIAARTRYGLRTARTTGKAISRPALIDHGQIPRRAVELPAPR